MRNDKKKAFFIIIKKYFFLFFTILYAEKFFQSLIKNKELSHKD